jgi:hypothetical protein
VSKKEYNAKEAAVALLDKIKAKVQGRKVVTKEETLEKAAPQNQTSAQIADIKIPGEASPPKANEKVVPKKPELKLKKFMSHVGEKRMSKAEKRSK